MKEMAYTNPLRYRSYVYDHETGLYYLQSRYYDPTTGRFISPDAFVSTGQGILGNNMFAYCLNNPNNFADPSGHDAIVLFDKNSFGHIGIMAQDNDGVWWHFYWGTKGGFVGNIFRVLAFLDVSVSTYTWCKEYTEEVTLDAINSSKQYGGEYEEWTYMEGNFSECVDQMMNPGKTYNLYSRNCSQVSLYILSKADTPYHKMLLYASGYTLPATANLYIKRNIGYCEPVLLNA